MAGERMRPGGAPNSLVVRAREQGHYEGRRDALDEVRRMIDDQLAFLLDRWPPDTEVRADTLRGLRAQVDAARRGGGGG